MNNIYDGIIGLAVGDALGVPVEFLPREIISQNPINSMREFGTHKQPKGTWSDDTSMTLAFIDSLICCKGIDYDDIMNRFLLWFKGEKYLCSNMVFGAGKTVSKAIMSYYKGEIPLKCGCKRECDNGNGSLMRILPMAFYLCSKKDMTLESQIELVHNVSSLTHANHKSMIGCGIYVLIAIEIITKRKSLIECIKSGVETAFRYYDRIKYNSSSYVRLRNIDIFKAVLENEIFSSGYVVHSLEAALWCLLNSHSYKECVLKAVNLGGDTDTIEAITGGLAGIYYGSDNIPEEWRNTVAGNDYIKGLCDDLQKIL